MLVCDTNIDICNYGSYIDCNSFYSVSKCELPIFPCLDSLSRFVPIVLDTKESINNVISKFDYVDNQIEISEYLVENDDLIPLIDDLFNKIEEVPYFPKDLKLKISFFSFPYDDGGENIEISLSTEKDVFLPPLLDRFDREWWLSKVDKCGNRLVLRV